MKKRITITNRGVSIGPDHFRYEDRWRQQTSSKVTDVVVDLTYLLHTLGSCRNIHRIPLCTMWLNHEKRPTLADSLALAFSGDLALKVSLSGSQAIRSFSLSFSAFHLFLLLYLVPC
jgi:hypothetical protein